MNTEIRCSIELRADDDGRASPGRLVGTLITFGERAGDRAELFEPGSLTWPESGIVLNRQHSRAAPVVRVIPQVVGNQVVIDAPLLNTSAGRDIATEVRAGLLTGLSIEFRAVRQTWAGGVRRISQAVLKGAGLVDGPSYRGATVEVRARRKGFVPWL